MTKALHLLGTDTEDLAIISACLQDAVTWRADIAYLPSKHRFALVLNRFRWEGERDEKAAPERVRSGLHFDTVLKVRSQGIRPGRKIPLELLALSAEEEETGTRIRFHFAGGAQIELQAECLECQLHDLSEPWATQAVPAHEAITAEDRETEE